jgi:hypothetical protein
MQVIRPWVGRNYPESVSGNRVLLLGESNYDKSDEPETDYSNIVCENVEQCAINGRVRFFTKTAKLMLMAEGASLVSREQCVALWNRVAFNNYVPTVFKSNRVRPSPEDWLLGREALSAQVAEHRPDVVVALGLELGSRLGWLHEVAPEVNVVVVAHPSSFGFRYSQWVPRLATAFGPKGSGQSAA